MDYNNITRADSIITPLDEAIIWDVGIAESMTGNLPGEFFPSDIIDLADVTRYNMFFAYMSLSYRNNSLVSLADVSIVIQLPVQGDPCYYEPITLEAAPAGWVTYPNTPTGDGNNRFPISNFQFDEEKRFLTWSANSAIEVGEIGTIFVKIPMRKPYTSLGTFEYIAYFLYSGTMKEGTTELTINGTKDLLPYTIVRQTDLGFVPAEVDADDFYYHKYIFETPYNPNYIMPPRSYQHDLAYIDGVEIRVRLPEGAEIVALARGMTSSAPGRIEIGAFRANKNAFVIRLPKSLYPNPSDIITLEAVGFGRYAGEDFLLHDLEGTEETISHEVGAQTIIPEASLGSVQFIPPRNNFSNEGLKTASVSFSRGLFTFARQSDTIIADEMRFEFTGIQWVTNGIASEADYGITMMLIYGVTWSGSTDRNNPVTQSVVVIYDDGSSEVLASATQEELEAIGGNALYAGNAVVEYGFDPPVGKIAKQLIVIIENAPAGARQVGYVNGYASNYPEGGADRLRVNYNVAVYGYDTGGGRPVASGSGNVVYDGRIERNTKFSPDFTIERTNAGTIGPGGTDVLRVSAIFMDSTKQSFLNPEFDILLPAGFAFISYQDMTKEFLSRTVSVYDLPDGILTITPPVVTSIPNYNGTGRNLIRIQYTGVLQPYETVEGDLTIQTDISVTSGDHEVAAWFSGENADFQGNLENTNTPVVTDIYDVNGNGSVTDQLFGREIILTITHGLGTLLYTSIKGSLDPDFVTLPSIATTKQNTQIDGKLTLEYNGLTPMENIQLISILPYQGDPNGSLWGGASIGQRIQLVDPVDVSAYPGAEVFYNVTPTDVPEDPGWSTIYSADVRAVRIVMPEDFQLQNGGVEKIDIFLRMEVPGTTTIEGIPDVIGQGLLPIKAFASTVLASGGLTGENSAVRSLALALSAFVFDDRNGDGIFDGGDVEASGVTIRVFVGSDDIETAMPLFVGVTDINGEIEFMDGFNGVDFQFQSYKIQVVKRDPTDVFTVGPDVTVELDGTQVVVFSSVQPEWNVSAGFQTTPFTLTGRYWTDIENPPNGIFDPRDLLNVGAVIRVFNVSAGTYETVTATVDFNGVFTFPGLAKGPLYRVEFPFNSDQLVSPIAAGGNMITQLIPGTGIFYLNSATVIGDEFEVNGAIYANGNIRVVFMDGDTIVSTSALLVRPIGLTYTATISSVEDINPISHGTFVLPPGYRLVDGEMNSKSVATDYMNTSVQIVFQVERIGASVRIHKVDEEDPSISLANAVFTSDNRRNYVTDQNGEAVLGLLRVGNYSFREIEPAPGYELNPSNFRLETVENGDGSVSVSYSIDNGVPIPLIKDSDGFFTAPVTDRKIVIPDPAAIRIRKLDAEHLDFGIPGATFQDTEGNSFLTDFAGYAVIGEFNAGEEFTLTELQPAPGYVPNESMYHVTISDNGDGTLSVDLSVDGGVSIPIEEDEDGYFSVMILNDETTPPQFIMLRMLKIDSETREGLASAVFHDPGTGMDYETDEYGFVAIGAVFPGELILQETITPPGYVTNNAIYTISVIQEEGEFQVTITQNSGLQAELTLEEDGTYTAAVLNQKEIPPPIFDLRIHKTDANAPDFGIEGVVFQDNDTLETYITDANGFAVVGPLVVDGTVSIKEQQAAEGYVPNDSIYTLETHNNGDGTLLVELIIDGQPPIELYEDLDGFYTIEIENVPVDPPEFVLLRVQLVDQNSQRGLSGGVLRVNESGAEYITDEQGFAFIGDVEPGILTLQEIIPPVGYRENNGIYTLIVSETVRGLEVQLTQNGGFLAELIQESDGTYTLIISNQPIGSLPAVNLRIHKTSNQHPDFGVPGAVFENSETLQIYETDAYGFATLGQFEENFSFSFIESQPGEGYFPNNLVFMVDIQSGPSGVPIVSFTIENQPSVVLTEDSEGFYTIEMTNDEVFPSPFIQLKVFKMDADIPEQGLPGAAFVIVESGLNYVTNQDGYAFISSVFPGILTLSEVVPPEGYQLNPSGYAVRVVQNSDETKQVFVAQDNGNEVELTENEDGTYTLDVPDQKVDPFQTICLMLRKVDSKSPDTGLPGAVFHMLETNRNYRSDIQGFVTIGEVYPGILTLQERVSPAGYRQNPNPYIIRIIQLEDGIHVEVSQEQGAYVKKNENGSFTVIIPNRRCQSSGCQTCKLCCRESCQYFR